MFRIMKKPRTTRAMHAVRQRDFDQLNQAEIDRYKFQINNLESLWRYSSLTWWIAGWWLEQAHVLLIIMDAANILEIRGLNTS